MDIYLDIDGVLRACASTREDREAFLRYILDNYPGRAYWLTSYCIGGANNATRALRNEFSDELLDELAEKIEPALWSYRKTEGINFEHNFVWFDDNLGQADAYALENEEALRNFYQINPRDPEAIKNALEYLKRLGT